MRTIPGDESNGGEMQVAELKDAKESLEETLQLAIHNYLKGFQDDTGFCPESCNVSLIHIQRISEKRKRLASVEVDVTVEIFR